jgi:cytochrome P450
MSNTVLTTPEYHLNPYPAFAQMREETPAYKTNLPSGEEVYVVTRYSDVVAGLKDVRLVKNIANARAGKVQGAVNSSNMLKADPPEHTRLRALAHAAFTPKVVNQMRDRIQELTDELIDVVAKKGEMDLIEEFAFPLPINVICEMLGVPKQDAPLFRHWSQATVAAELLSKEEPEMIPELYELLQYLDKLTRERAENLGDDFISDLIRVEADGEKLTHTELVSTTALLLGAGHETTVNLIGNGMFMLLQDGEQLEKLKANPDLIKPAVEELLRFVNPVQYVNRYASEALEIGGMNIPKGAHLLLAIAAANHDSAYTHEPESLDLTHGDTRHVAFGLGIHYCLGAPLARLEGEIAFATLLRRLPNIHLAVAPAQIEWRPSITLRGLHSLPVKFDSKAYEG